MPPTGMSQWPVPRPTTWYRKQRLASRSWAWVNVPISASVSTMPRERVVGDVLARCASPIGRSTNIRHASSPMRRRKSPALRSGSVSVGNTRSAIVAIAGPRAPRIGSEDETSRRTQLDVQAQLVDDLRRQQADEVRVLRQLGVVGREHTRRPRRAADHRVAFEHERQTGPPRRGRPHTPARCARHRRRRRRTGPWVQPTVSLHEGSRRPVRARHRRGEGHRAGDRRAARRGGRTGRRERPLAARRRERPRRTSAAAPSVSSSTSPTTRRSAAPSTTSSNGSAPSTCSSTTPAGTAWSRSSRAAPRRGTSCWRSTCAARSP